MVQGSKYSIIVELKTAVITLSIAVIRIIATPEYISIGGQSCFIRSITYLYVIDVIG